MYLGEKPIFFLCYDRRFAIIEEKWTLNILHYYFEHNVGRKYPKTHTLFLFDLTPYRKFNIKNRQIRMIIFYIYNY